MVVGTDINSSADVIFAIEGTAINGAYLNEIKSNYIIPTLEYFSQGSLDERDYVLDDSTSALYGIVVYHAADRLPSPCTDIYGPYSNPKRFLHMLDKLELVGGRGESHANVAEALATSLVCFDDMQLRRDPGLNPQKHCILICNSPPYLMPVTENQTYAGNTAEQLAVLFNERSVHLTILSPRKIPAMFKLYEKAGGDLTSIQTKNYAKDRRHLVLLKGFSLKERPVSPGGGATPHLPVSMASPLPNGGANTMAGGPTPPVRFPVYTQPQNAPRQSTRWPLMAQRPQFSQPGSALIEQLTRPPSSIAPQFANAGGIPSNVAMAQQQQQQQQQQVVTAQQQMRMLAGGGGTGGNLMAAGGAGPGMMPGATPGMMTPGQGPPNQGLIGASSGAGQGMMGAGPGAGQTLMATSTGPGQGMLAAGAGGAPGMIPTPGTGQGMMAAGGTANPGMMNTATPAGQGIIGGGANASQGIMPGAVSAGPGMMTPQGTQGLMVGVQNQMANQQPGQQPTSTMPQQAQQGLMAQQGGIMTQGQPTQPGLMNQQQPSTQPIMAQQPLGTQPTIGPQPTQQPSRERMTIWQGILEWIEKMKNTNEPQKFTRHVPCQVSSQTKDGEPEIKADSWPQKLIMQLMPKQLIGSIGGSFLKNSKSVLFHPQACEALEALTKVMSSGFAGCVHFSSVPPCEIKVLILLYTPDKRTFLGFIPNDQNAFVDRLRKVIQQQKISHASLRQQGAGQAGPAAAPGIGPNPQTMPGLMQQPNQQQQSPGLGANAAGTGGGMLGGVQGGNAGMQAGLQPGMQAGPATMQVNQGLQPQAENPGQQPPTSQGGGAAGGGFNETARQENLVKIQRLRQTLEAAQQQELQYKQLESRDQVGPLLYDGPSEQTSFYQDQRQPQQQQQPQDWGWSKTNNVNLIQFMNQIKMQQIQDPSQMNPQQSQLEEQQKMRAQLQQMQQGAGLQQRMMRPGMPNNPGLRHLLQQPQYRLQIQNPMRPGGMPNTQQQNQQQQQFDDVPYDFLS